MNNFLGWGEACVEAISVWTDPVAMGELRHLEKVGVYRDDTESQERKKLAEAFLRKKVPSRFSR